MSTYSSTNGQKSARSPMVPSKKSKRSSREPPDKPPRSKTSNQKSDKEKVPDLRVVLEKWRACQLADEDIEMQSYVDAYQELGRFMRKMGFLFGFVVKDIDSKLRILNELMSESRSAYGTVERLLRREVAQRKARIEGSGSLALIRLHRAMDFVIQVLQSIHDEDDQTNMGPAATRIYDRTLGTHLPWYVNTAVHLAMTTLKRRKEFLADFTGPLTREEVLEIMQEAIIQGKIVYKRVQAKFVLYSLQNLPQQ